MAGQTNTKVGAVRNCNIWDTIITVALVCFGAISFITLGPYIDEKFPVVEPFVVTKTELADNTLKISGWLYKRRGCERVAILAYVRLQDSLPVAVPVQFYDNTMKISRPEGLHEWGPWEITVPKNVKTVELTSSHKCHPFWLTKTNLGVVYE